MVHFSQVFYLGFAFFARLACVIWEARGSHATGGSIHQYYVSPMSSKVFESFLRKKAEPNGTRSTGQGQLDRPPAFPAMRDDDLTGRCAHSACAGVVDIEDLHTIFHAERRDAVLSHDAVADDNDGWTVVSYHHHQARPRPPERVRLISQWWQRRREVPRSEHNADLPDCDTRRTATSHESRVAFQKCDGVRKQTRGRRGFLFDSTCGYKGEGPKKNATDGDWHTTRRVFFSAIRKGFPGQDDGAIISEAQRLLSTGKKSSDKLTVEQLVFLQKAWPKVLTPSAKPAKPAAPGPTEAGPAGAEEVKSADAETLRLQALKHKPGPGAEGDNTRRVRTEEEKAQRKQDSAKRREASRLAAHLKSLEGPGAGAAADSVDPKLMPPIAPPGDDDVPVPFVVKWAKEIAKSEADAIAYESIIEEIRSIVHSKYQFADFQNSSDRDSVLKTVHAWAKTRDLVGVISSLNRHYQTPPFDVGPPVVYGPAHILVESLYDREVHAFATSSRRTRQCTYNFGDRGTKTTFGPFVASSAIEATVFDAISGRPNINSYVVHDSMTNLPLSGSCEVARRSQPLGYRSSDGTPDWKLRLADSVSRSCFSGVVGFAEECGKRLVSSAAVHIAVIACPLAHAAAVAGVIGYIAGAATLASIETWSKPDGLSWGARFIGHAVTGLTGHAGTAAHVIYNAAVTAIGRPSLALDSVHATRSQPSECLSGIVQPMPVQHKATLRLGTEPCTPTFGVQRLIQVGTVTQSVPRQCVCNSEIALTHRVLRPLPMHDILPDVALQWKLALPDAAHLASKVGFGDAMPFFRWLNRYGGNKKRTFAALRQARPPMVHTTKAKVFIKSEKYPRSIEGAKNSPPRIISGCPEELTYHTGRWLTSAAKRAATSLSAPDGRGGGGRIFYTCGYNSDQIGDLLRVAIESIIVDDDDQLIFLEDDQSKFDQHIGESAFRCLDEMYRTILPTRVRKLLRRGRSRGGLRNGTTFSVDYTMQSGYPDTSFGDTMLNAVMKTFIHGRGGNWASLICGDDSVTVTTRSEIARLGGVVGIRAAYAKFGMEVEASYGTNVLDVGYCSGRFLPQFNTFALVPKTGKILSKSFWSTRQYSDINLRAWANGVCNSLDLIGKRDPIVAAVSRVVRAQTHTRKIRYNNDVAGGSYSVVYHPGEGPVDHASIAYAYSHWYNLFSHDVEYLRTSVANSFVFDACVDDPLLNYVVRLDTPS